MADEPSDDPSNRRQQLVTERTLELVDKQLGRRRSDAGRAPLYVYRALALRKLGRGEEAEKELAVLLTQLNERTKDDDVSGLFFLGLARKTAGESEAAAAALQQSRQLYPWQPRAKRLLTSDVIL